MQGGHHWATAEMKEQGRAMRPSRQLLMNTLRAPWISPCSALHGGHSPWAPVLCQAWTFTWKALTLTRAHDVLVLDTFSHVTLSHSRRSAVLRPFQAAETEDDKRKVEPGTELGPL